MTHGIIHPATGKQDPGTCRAFYREGAIADDDPATRSREVSRRLGPRPSQPGVSSAGHLVVAVPSRTGVAGHD